MGPKVGARFALVGRGLCVGVGCRVGAGDDVGMGEVGMGDGGGEEVAVGASVMEISTVGLGDEAGIRVALALSR